MKLREILTGSVVAVSYLVAAHALARAQEAPAQTTADDGAEEVVVTALKRSGKIQKAPASITAISGTAMAERGLDDLRALSKVVPSLHFGEHLGTTLITIRGVGSTVESGITEPTVAVYSDGVFLPRSTMAMLRAVDLERVEVLRGPQGTLYGRNATGGAVNFISKEPTEDLTSGFTLLTGSRASIGGSAYVSGPIATGVYFRISGGHEEQDGYVRVLNTGARINGTNVSYARGALRIDASDKVRVDLSARFEESRAANAYQQLLSPTALAGPGGQTQEPNEIVADYPHDMYVRTFVGAAKVTWDIADNIALQSLTSYVDHKSDVIGLDADGTSTPFYHVEHFLRPSQSFGQEFTLTADWDRLNLLVGAFYFHEEAGNALPVVFDTVGAGAVGLPIGATFYQSVDTTTESLAAFVDLTYSVSDNFRVNLGLRLNNEKQDFIQTLDLSVAGASLPGFPLSAPLDDASTKILPKIGLQFDISDTSRIYAQWSQGYKSGGVNLAGTGGELFGPVFGPYKPEEIDAFEIGLKSEWFNDKLTVNVAAFYYDYHNLQVNITIPPSTTQVNNADAGILGFEAELRWLVTDDFKLTAAATLLHARFDGFSDINPATGLLENLDNSPIPNAPDITINFGAEYRADLGGELFGSLTLRGDIAYSDDVVLRYFSHPEDIQKSFTIANLSATLADSEERLRLTLFVNNVADVTYKQATLYFGDAYYGNYGPPRTWGLRLSKDF